MRFLRLVPLLMVPLLLTGCDIRLVSPIEDALNAVATNLAGLAQALSLQAWVTLGALLFLALFAAIVLRRQAKSNEILVKNHMLSQMAFTFYLMKKDGLDPDKLKKDLAKLHDYLLEGDKPSKPKRKTKAKTKAKRKTKHVPKKK